MAAEPGGPERGLPAAALALAAAAALGSCSVNPATGQSDLMLMSLEREREAGQEEHDKLLASGVALYHQDEELLAYVTEVGMRIARVSHMPELDFRFHIVDSHVINAFALPGGFVYVHRGLLAHLASEAELAGVIAHEVAHVTARHFARREVRRDLADAAGQVTGVLAAVATRSNQAGAEIRDVTRLWAQVGISGFGRERELEADSLGAEYLLAAGYDPSAILVSLTALKNEADFRRKVTGAGGGYHGLFASHPRDDFRLQRAIAAVGEAGGGAAARRDDTAFRLYTEGLPFGPAIVRNADERNRYYQTTLGYTVVFPDGWEIAETPTTATASAPGIGSLRIEARRITKNLPPREYLMEATERTELRRSEALSQYRLRGHTAVIDSERTGAPERAAVVYFGPRAFIFRGEILGPDGDGETDGLLREAIASFRAIQRGEVATGEEPKVRWAQASEHFDYATVARSSRIAEHAEETLRLINGHYPSGGPKAGEWIKLIE